MTMVESSRKHGEFDGRYPVLPKLKARTWAPELADKDADQLDWSAFLTRFFPEPPSPRPSRTRGIRGLHALVRTPLCEQDRPEGGCVSQTEQEIVEGMGSDYAIKYGFSLPEDYFFKSGRGLDYFLARQLPMWEATSPRSTSTTSTTTRSSRPSR